MTTAPVPPTPPGPSPEQPLLTAHAAIVLLMAAFFGEIAGVLTFLGTANTATALLAGLTAMAVSAPVLNKAIGH
ncbi:hypothetical protein OHT93_38680 [Streptomyces sp. NBC_00191]|uniref:hypothetical protein n=1 Tax=Streptomyces sp. NBC_00191 TaxID=2975674 RepID=UPI00324A2D09